MTEPPSYPKTSRDQRDEPKIGDAQGSRSMILVAIIVVVLVVLLIVLHVTGVVGPGTNA